jgi:neutral amino acid transport system permease protein
MVDYLVSLAIYTSIFALFALGLNLQWGFTGLVNFGHVAFMTVGAYTTVLLSLKGVPLFIAALIGGVLAAILGLAIGFSTLRLREDYLSIVTIGVGELIRLIVNNQDLPVGDKWISGAFGLQSYPIPLAVFSPSLFSKFLMIGLLTVVAGIALWQLFLWVKNAQPMRVGDGTRKIVNNQELISRLGVAVVFAVLSIAVYISGVISLYNYNPKAGLMLISLIILALFFWRLEILLRSPWGRILKGIREDEEVPKALGKNVFAYKLQSLMLGGAAAGIAGALFAWQIGAVYPDSFLPQATFDCWVMVMLGGAGNNVGTILGSVIFFGYDALTREFLPKIIPLDDARLGAFRIMIIGLILIVLMIWRPQGVLGKKEELTLGK